MLTPLPTTSSSRQVDPDKHTDFDSTAPFPPPPPPPPLPRPVPSAPALAPMLLSAARPVRLGMPSVRSQQIRESTDVASASTRRKPPANPRAGLAETLPCPIYSLQEKTKKNLRLLLSCDVSLWLAAAGHQPPCLRPGIEPTTSGVQQLNFQPSNLTFSARSAPLYRQREASLVPQTSPTEAVPGDGGVRVLMWGHVNAGFALRCVRLNVRD